MHWVLSSHSWPRVSRPADGMGDGDHAARKRPMPKRARRCGPGFATARVVPRSMRGAHLRREGDRVSSDHPVAVPAEEHHVGHGGGVSGGSQQPCDIRRCGATRRLSGGGVRRGVQPRRDPPLFKARRVLALRREGFVRVGDLAVQGVSPGEIGAFCSQYGQQRKVWTPYRAKRARARTALNSPAAWPGPA